MPFLRKSPSGVYQIGWRCYVGCEKHPEGGKQHTVSTGLTDGKRAAVLFDEKIAALEDDKARIRLGIARVRHIAPLTLRQTHDWYEKKWTSQLWGAKDAQSVRKVAGTIETDLMALRHLMKYAGGGSLKAGEGFLVSGLTKSFISGYDDNLIATVAAYTRYSRRRQLTTIFNDLVAFEQIQANPFYAVMPNGEKVSSWPPMDKPKTTVVDSTREEVIALLAKASPLIHALIRFLYLTGCRLSAALELQKDGVDRANRVVTFTGGNRRKKRPPQDLTPDLEAAIDDAITCETNGNVVSLSPFVFARQGQRLNKRWVQKQFEDLAETCGFEFHAHMLRHAARTHAEEAGVPSEVVNAKLGQTADTARGYRHMGVQSQRMYADKLTLRTLLRKEA